MPVQISSYPIKDSPRSCLMELRRDLLSDSLILVVGQRRQRVVHGPRVPLLPDRLQHRAVVVGAVLAELVLVGERGQDLRRIVRHGRTW